MKKKMSILLVLILFNISLLGQVISINGYVSDSETGEKLIGANVYSIRSNKGAVTNNYGYFTLTVPYSDTITIVASYIGYKEEIKKISKIKTNISIAFSLIPGALINEVEVKGLTSRPIHEQVEMSMVEIPIKQIKTLPMLGGESDIMKALQLMPGIQSGNEGSSGLFVRGGSADQNLIIFDDVPLYYINHLGGFVSIFNTDAIKNIKLYKGGFPARYGSRLSSVVDIRMKEGNTKNFQASGTIGLISSKVAIEGPIKKEESSYIIMYRRFMLDLFMRPFTKIETGDLTSGYTFYDLNLKVNHKLSNNDRLYFSLYTGDDKIFNSRKEKEDGDLEKSKNHLKWGNAIGALRWNHIYNHRLFSNFTISYTRYRYLSEFFSVYKNDNNETEQYNNSFNSSINDLSVKFDFEHHISSKIKLKYGIVGIFHEFTPGIESFKKTGTETTNIDTLFNNKNYYSFENATYLENIFNPWPKLNLNIGIRASMYNIKDKSFQSLEPRLLLNYLIKDNMSVKASYASMKQYVHLLTYSGIGLPSDLWVPSTLKAPPEYSYQCAIGIANTIVDNSIDISLEAYYKKLSNLLTFEEGASFLGNSTEWEDKVNSGGEGRSYGTEFLLQKKSGILSGWCSYTLSKSERRFTNINQSIYYPYKYDRRHDISIVSCYQINEKITISLTWVYGTGNAISLPTAYHKTIDYSLNETDGSIGNSTEYEIDIYKSKNGFRMRDYHRLDIGASFKKEKKWGERTLSIGVYNLYNRKNPYYYYFDKIGSDNNQRKRLYQKSLFPFLPSISYSFRFD